MGAKCCRSDLLGSDNGSGDVLSDKLRHADPWVEDSDARRPFVDNGFPSPACPSTPLPLKRASTQGDPVSRASVRRLTPITGKRRLSGSSSIGVVCSERTTSADEEVEQPDDHAAMGFHRTRSEGFCIMKQDQSRRTSTSSGKPRARGSLEGNRAPPAEICCLAWSIHSEDVLRVQESELVALHEHLHSCIDLFGLEVLTEEATRGVLRGTPFPDSKLNAEDTALRVGQLICRQASANQIGLRVGVHSGRVRTMELQGAECKTVYFGEACMGATQLADSAQMWTVHISGQAKAKLSAFRHVQMTISPDRSSYFLNPCTAVGNYFGGSQSSSRPCSPKGGSSRSGSKQGVLSAGLGPFCLPEESDRAPSSLVTNHCTLQAFEEMLVSHDVDIECFGKGSASSLQELHKAVVLDRKNDLVLSELGQLVRVVNLVRISLRIRDNDNKLRELRLVSESPGDGIRGGSNMPLAITLTLSETSRWREAVESSFEQKLDLPIKTQRANFHVNMDSYRYMEECSKSERFPGLLTRYKSHNIVINVKDKHAEGLRGIGLPSGESFNCQSSDGQGRSWTWALIGDTKEDELMNLLQAYGIDASELDPHAFAELCDEVHRRSLSVLDTHNGELVRTVRIIKVWLHATILNVDHVLTIKAKFRRGHYNGLEQDRGISMRMQVDQDWEEAVTEALATRLGLSESFQARHLSLDRSSHALCEEIGYSKSYPGLKTCYRIDEVQVHIVEPQAITGLIGLPGGTDFAFARKEALQDPEAGELVVSHFHWITKEEIDQQRSAFLPRVATVADLEDEQDLHGIRSPTSVARSATWTTDDHLRLHRVPLPLPLQAAASEMSRGGTAAHASVSLLANLMRDRKTNWARARTAAERIRDPDYSCRAFHDDIVAAFPELRLYCVQGEDGEEAPATSGRTPDDEYQRTIGALFAVFWLMRLDLNGKEGFCLGVTGEDWTPRSAADIPVDTEEQERFDKRLSFQKGMDWTSIWHLFADAGLVSSSDKGVRHDVDRTLAMLVLMAIHDIMKLAPLLPTVDRKVKEFGGYKTGELISDHDIALSYVLTHHPDVLPSFAGLSKASQESVKFTHCKLDYNMGWLVQAEAPPGALFKTFRQVVTCGKASPSDIAFYFVHWFVDLAGAEPTPLNGCEKFVLRFPQHVLVRFMESFSFVQGLSPHKTETQVMQEYLIGCWDRARPSLGVSPVGEGSVARMRLVLMAQGDSAELLRSFDKLPIEDKLLLSDEMAITGCKDQGFVRDSNVFGKGPAILLYYAPAMLQKMGCKDATALQILAEVWRQARELWPLCKKDADSTVTVRIDALKELEAAKVFTPEPGHIWVISKTSGKDAAVRLVPASELKALDWKRHQVMTFARGPKKRSKGRFSDVFATADKFKAGRGYPGHDTLRWMPRPRLTRLS